MSVCIAVKNAQLYRHVTKRDVTFKWATFVTNVASLTCHVMCDVTFKEVTFVTNVAYLIVSRDDVAVQMSPT